MTSLRTIFDTVYQEVKYILHRDFRSVNESTIGILLVLPLVILFVALYGYPILKAFEFSLHRITLFATDPVYIGLDNYIGIIPDETFLNALFNGLLYTITSTIVALILGIWTAILLNKSFIGERWITGLILSPYLIPMVGAVIIFRWLFNGLNGAANFFFVQIGLIDGPIAWFGLHPYVWPMLVTITSWRLYPVVTMMVLAKLQTIPDTYYEAAELMGASRIRMFVSITLPQLREVLFIAILLRLIWTFNLFDIIWLGTRGGPARSTETLAILAYRLAFTEYNLGQAATVAVLMFLTLFIGISVYFKLFNRGE